MGRSITINQQHTLEQIHQEIRSTRDGRYRLRLQVIALVFQKKSSLQIREQLLVSIPSVFKWVKLYNEQGLAGISNVPTGGREEGNPLWDKAVFEALFAKLDLMQEYWSVPKMAAWIQDAYDVSIPERTIHNRLKANGYSFKSSRPNPYKGDPNLQASFKKTE